MIYLVTLGPEAPVSLGGFLRETLTTANGWAMIVLGIGVGGLFALVPFVLSFVSLPLLMEHDVGLRTALGVSWRVLRTNPRTMALWGALVAGGLVLGALPALLGLIFVFPLLGHATWHLYRRVLPPKASRHLRQWPAKLCWTFRPLMRSALRQELQVSG